MKKKGLIVATIVMVLVLAVSLTTATYAWFTVSDSTSIDGFNLSVSAGNVMNIGLNNSTYTTYSSTAGPDSFDSGDCVYSKGTSADGQFLGGYWTGTTGLNATVGHDIQWAAQSKAVGFTTATTATSASISNTGFANFKDSSDNPWTHVIRASGTAQASMSGQEFAVPNRRGATAADADNGDFVYMWLGAQPTKYIIDGTNYLYIVVQPQGTGTTIGMAAAIHVAYRLNNAIDDGAWTDVDVFGAANNNGTEYSYNTLKTNGPDATINGDYASSTDITGGTSTKNESTGVYTTVFEGAAVVAIPLSNYTNGTTTAAPLDQIQIVIYIAGSDSDCRDEAKAGQIGIGIFFGAQEYVAPAPSPQD